MQGPFYKDEIRVIEKLTLAFKNQELKSNEKEQTPDMSSNTDKLH